jgi:hypothetical protein
MLTKQEVLERLCLLCNDVARDVAEFPSNPADCFCNTNPLGSSNYKMDERVIEYIERVVYASGIQNHDARD